MGRRRIAMRQPFVRAGLPFLFGDTRALQVGARLVEPALERSSRRASRVLIDRTRWPGSDRIRMATGGERAVRRLSQPGRSGFSRSASRVSITQPGRPRPEQAAGQAPWIIGIEPERLGKTET
jgi:hypothetical protein